MNPITSAEVDEYFVWRSVAGAIFTSMMQLGIALIILIRTLSFYKVIMIDVEQYKTLVSVLYNYC
jgi:hypothetical protein